MHGDEGREKSGVGSDISPEGSFPGEARSEDGVLQPSQQTSSKLIELHIYGNEDVLAVLFALNEYCERLAVDYLSLLRSAAATQGYSLKGLMKYTGQRTFLTAYQIVMEACQDS